MRIGLLGAARITSTAIIAPAKAIPSAILHGIAARDRQRAQAFAQQHGVAVVFDDYGSLIASKDIDLIYNALPINLHAEWTLAALQAGKHVLCEKPLAMNTNEAETMLAAASPAGPRLVEAFHYFYHPAYQTLLDWITAGTIGEVKTLVAEFNVSIADADGEIRHRPDTGGGAMMDLGCYPVSWALTIANANCAPSSITADASMTPSGVDESMQANIEFPNGMTARLAASMAPGLTPGSTLHVTGTHGEIDFVNPVSPHSGASLTLTTVGKRQVAPISRVSTYTYQLAAVLDALASGNELPMEGANILRQQQTLDNIYAAAGLAHLRHICS